MWRAASAFVLLAGPAFAGSADTIVTVNPSSNSPNTITLSDASGLGETNYPLLFGRPFVQGAIPHYPQVFINGTPAPVQADIKNRYPDGSAMFAAMAVVVPVIPPGGSVTLTFQDTLATSAPMTTAQMQTLLPVGLVTSTFAGATTTTVVDAGQMLLDGNCQPWRQGQVAQTMICRDDTAARKYDVGFGDGYHPVRPAFYVTFWPGINAVSVRPEAENDLTTEIEDAAYNLTVVAGPTTKTLDLMADQATYPKKHWTASSWILGPYWIGAAAPNPEVNIDNNLAYLASTRFLPNFDPAVHLTEAQLASEYSNYTHTSTGAVASHDPYDGYPGLGTTDLTNTVGDAGNNPWLGPFPRWVDFWLYTGDWRMRQASLGVADGSGSYGGDLRESDPTRRFLRSDAVGSGTGLGRVASIAGRPGVVLSLGGKVCGKDANGSLVGKAFCFGYGDYLPLITVETNIGGGNPWGGPALDHLPDTYVPVYMLTGDPWYLNQMYNWMAIGLSTICVNNTGGFIPGCRGPNGAYANVSDEMRGEAWAIRTNAEDARLAPDGTPEKAYFTTTMNDILGYIEGQLGIVGTPFDGTQPKVWGAEAGDAESTFPQRIVPAITYTGTGHYPPPLNQWSDFGNAGTDTQQAKVGIFVPGAVGGVASPWMEEYALYGVGRAAELGYAARPLQAYLAQYFLQVIAANPMLLDQYEMPVDNGVTAFFPTWDAVQAALEPSYLTGVGWNPANGDSLPQLYAQGSGSRHTWLQPGLAMAVDAGLTTWDWWQANLYSLAQEDQVPLWAVVPRTDTNVLPPQ